MDKTGSMGGKEKKIVIRPTREGRSGKIRAQKDSWDGTNWVSCPGREPLIRWEKNLASKLVADGMPVGE